MKIASFSVEKNILSTSLRNEKKSKYNYVYYTIKCHVFSCPVGLHRVHQFQFRNPDAALVCRFIQPCFLLAHKRDGLRFRIIAKYMVKTKFDDALKILVAREKMANSVVGCQYAMCKSVRSSFLKLFIFHL